MAAAAAVLLEDGEPGRAGSSAPFFMNVGELGRRDDVGVAAHERVAEAAELGADHRERAEVRRRDHERVVLARARRPASARTRAPRTSG